MKKHWSPFISLSLMLLLSLFSLNSHGMSGGGGGGGGGKGGEKPEQYLQLAPFIVNIRNADTYPRYMQVILYLKGKDKDFKAIESAKQHLAPIRDAVIMILADLTYEELSSSEGKKKMRENLLKAIQKVLDEKAEGQGTSSLEDILITSLVVQ